MGYMQRQSKEVRHVRGGKQRKAETPWLKKSKYGDGERPDLKKQQKQMVLKEMTDDSPKE